MCYVQSPAALDSVRDSKSRLESYFDRSAIEYDTKHGVVLAGQAYNFVRYYEPFLAGPIPSGSSVLEVGCGTGIYTRWLTGRGCRVVAMDLSGAMLEQARRRCPEASLYVGDCQWPSRFLPEPICSQRFDAILGVNSFSYYAYKSEALAEYHGLLRTPGRLVLLDMNGRCPYYRLMRWLGKNELPRWFHDIRECRQEVLKRMLRVAGFRIRDLVHFCFVPNGVGHGVVAALGPVDRMLMHWPTLRKLAMRIGVVAERV